MSFALSYRLHTGHVIRSCVVHVAMVLTPTVTVTLFNYYTYPRTVHREQIYTPIAIAYRYRYSLTVIFLRGVGRGEERACGDGGMTNTGAECRRVRVPSCVEGGWRRGVRSDIVLAAIEVQGRASGPLLAQGFGPSRPSPFASRRRLEEEAKAPRRWIPRLQGMSGYTFGCRIAAFGKARV